MNSFDIGITDERVKKGWKLINKKNIKTITINDVLDRYLPIGQKIDFINIDIEGMELDILKSIDWKKYCPDYLLIEELNLVNKDIIMSKKTDIYNLLINQNFSVVAKTRRTMIYKNNLVK